MFARTDATSVFDSGSPGARRNSAFGSASGRRRADGETTRRERATGRLPASATIGARLVSTVSNAAAAFWLVVFVDDGPAFVTRVAAPHQGDGPSLDRVLETNRRSRAAEFAPFGKSKSEHSKNPLPSGDDASGADPTTNCPDRRWPMDADDCLAHTRFSRTPLRAFLRRFAPSGLSTRSGLRLTCRVLEPLSDLGEPFHLGLEGPNTLIAGAVWAGEQTARGTHRDQLRRSSVFLLHGCLSLEQLACR